jgi:hypothetical protein
MLGRGPSRGGCRPTPTAKVQRSYLRTTPPAAATGCCLPLLVQRGEPFVTPLKSPLGQGGTLSNVTPQKDMKGMTALMKSGPKF